MIDYNSLSYLLKLYIFAINPQLDDVDSGTLAKHEIWAVNLDAMNTARTDEMLDPVAVRTGWLAENTNYEDSGGYLDSTHWSGDALDLDDFDGSLYTWLINSGTLDDLNLYVCDNFYTPGYIHIQLSDHSSTGRVFDP